MCVYTCYVVVSMPRKKPKTSKETSLHSSYLVAFFYTRTVVTMGVRALTFTGKALDGPVLAALQQGMKVLKYPKERAKELVKGIPADFRIKKG